MAKKKLIPKWIWIIIIPLIIYMFMDESLPGNYSDINLPSANGKTIVWIDGITGVPSTYTEMAAYFNDKGYGFYVPLMLNHGNKLSDIRALTIPEIKQDLMNRISQIKGDIIIGGTCSGGLLALDIANELNKSVILINPPIQSLGFWKYIPLPYTYRFDIGLLTDSSKLSLVPRYHKYSIKLLADLHEYEQTMPLTTKIPILIIQSDNDIRAHGYELLANKAVNSKVVNLHNSGHLAYLDLEKQIVFDSIENFIKGAK